MGKFLAVTRMAVTDAIIYRNDMIMWSISLILGPLVYLIVWVAISTSGGTPPLSQTEFVQYYLLVIVVRTWANSWNSQFIAADIRTGAISPFLVKPISYLVYRFGDSVGNRLIKAIFGLSAAVILGVIFHVVIPSASPLIWLAFAATLFMSGVIVTLMDICVGLLAFWLDDVTSIDELNDVLYMVFSGVVLPLVVFPAFIQELLVFLPYKYMVAFPVEVLMGDVKGQDLVVGIVMQAIWLVIFLVLYKVLWTKGQIRYQAFGS